MLMVAIFEERQNREWGRYMESARRFWKIAHSYKPYRVALKEMERIWAGVIMLCCPAVQNVTEHLTLQISKRMSIKNMYVTKAVE